MYESSNIDRLLALMSTASVVALCSDFLADRQIPAPTQTPTSTPTTPTPTIAFVIQIKPVQRFY
ncbi:MAG: hypothetical protein RMY30_006105 [Nostoc sp. CmiSLP01]|nr:hypothetical protein [Nostoc sp. CmiSLP01]